MRTVKRLYREVSHSWQQAAVFFLCVVLSVVTLASVNGFASGVAAVLAQDARALHAGDIIVQSRQPFSDALERAVEQVQAEGRMQTARYWEFYSVVQTPGDEGALLADIKVVEDGYPFYGRCILESGRPFSEELRSGSIIVERALLERLGIAVGDRLKIGRAELAVADVLVQEPDRPVSVFSFGPRIFVSRSDLERLELIEQRSRVRYVLLGKVIGADDPEALAARLQQAADPVQERVETYRTARSGVKRFMDNFVFFLNLVGVFTLILAGIGIHCALSAYLREKTGTIAVMKTLGATAGFIITRHGLALLSIAIGGTLVGLILAAVLQSVLPVWLSNFLPPSPGLTLPWGALAEGFALGVGAVALFAFLPLYRIQSIKPAFIFRNETVPPPRNVVYRSALAAVAALLIGLILWQLKEVKTGLVFVLGAAGFLVAVAVLVSALMALLRRIRRGPLIMRQALRGLFRPRSATRSILVTLTAALTVLLTLVLVEENLDRSFIQSYPPNSPNLFFIDIQPDQVEAFAQVLDRPARYHPIVRARIVSVNGEAVDRNRTRQPKRGDSLTRTFNLTFRTDLLEDETIVDGRGLFGADGSENQVSVLDTAAELAGVEIGDRMVFRIQGVPLEARVSSIRTRTSESIRPFFYFVFPPTLLAEAPHTFFTAVRVEADRIGALQGRLASEFPNVTAVDMSSVIRRFGEVAQRLSTVVRFFTLLSIPAGMLIVASSVFATRLARTREAVYYQVLGARNAFVRKVFLVESLTLGLAASLPALIFAETAAWLIITRGFEIPFVPLIGTALGLAAAATILVTLVALIPSWSILRVKPVVFLRQQTQE
ncbi:MAG TPA: ABC transporter permease [Desulfobacterales bacterium]